MQLPLAPERQMLCSLSSSMAHLWELGVKNLVSFAVVSPTSRWTPYRITGWNSEEREWDVWERNTYIYFLTPYSPGLCSAQCPLPYLPHLLVLVAIDMSNSFCPLPPHSHRVRLCPVCQERTLAFSPLGNCSWIHDRWLTSRASLSPSLHFLDSGQLVPNSFLHNKEAMSSKKKVRFFSSLIILSLHIHCFAKLQNL